MATYAVVDGNGAVVNRIVFDGDTSFDPGAGLHLVQETDHPFEIGGTYIGGNYTPPPAENPSPIPPLA